MIKKKTLYIWAGEYSGLLYAKDFPKLCPSM
jgi:hypothetical protein